MKFRALLLLTCLAGLVYAKTPRPLVNVPILTPAQKAIDLRKYRGQTVILVIFSTGCDDCIKTINIMNKLQAELGPKGLQVVGAAGDPNAKYLLEPFIQRYRPLFPLGYIDKDAIIKVAEIGPKVRPVVPIVMFVDKWGMVREQYFGDHPIFKDPERSLRALAQAVMSVQQLGVQAPAAK